MKKYPAPRMAGSGRACAALAIAALAALTGCSEEPQQARKYSVPASLCGIAVQPTSLAPFLPGGSSLSTAEASPVKGTKRCEVRVDGKPALTASQDWREKNARITAVALDTKHIDMAEYETTGSYLYEAGGAVARVDPCRNPSFTGDMFAIIEVRSPGLGSTAAMKQLITEYTDSVRESEACSSG
ncbi:MULTISPECIES: hypothetical protein [Streptomyces]|uniref:hypothetical protein n=1 Tax=Streptomyces TaxID=1883 RepID=UPI001F10A76E|nr:MULTISPECIES: hypothetical protein [Streptomyces]MCY0981357.1 hypothetical protein [Streptomyces tirandamycinicus]